MRRTVRVAHVVEAFCGGVLTHLRTILPRLAASDCEVSLICSLNRSWHGLPQIVSELQQADVAVHVVDMARRISVWDDATSLVKLLGILARGRFDVVHTHGSKAGVLGRVAARIAGVPIVVHTPHCFAFLRCPSAAGRCLYRGVERMLGRLTDVLVGVSQSEASIARSLRILPAARCVGLDNALGDLRRNSSHVTEAYRRQSRESFGITAGQRVVAKVARLVSYKGVLTFVEAAKACRAANAVFLIAGDGPLRATLKQKISSLGLGGKVRLLGHVEAMEDLYEATDVVVSCSRAEGQSYALLEAMRAGRAIVAAAVPENEELLRHGVSGYLVGLDPREIAAAIDRLLADDGLRLGFAAAAKDEFRLRRTPEAQVKRLSGLYTKCLNGSRR